MTAPIPNASKPPFTLARELYGELFEADKLETAMWHFSQMKPSEQRFIQSHLLFLLLHGQAVTNLNLRDVRERMASIEQRLQELEPGDNFSLEGREREADGGSAPEGDGVNEDQRQEEAGGEDDDEEDDEEDDSDDAVAPLDPDERRPDVAPASDARLSPQLEAAVSALEEALSFDSSPEEVR